MSGVLLNVASDLVSENASVINRRMNDADKEDIIETM